MSHYFFHCNCLLAAHTLQDSLPSFCSLLHRIGWSSPRVVPHGALYDPTIKLFCQIHFLALPLPHPPYYAVARLNYSWPLNKAEVKGADLLPRTSEYNLWLPKNLTNNLLLTLLITKQFTNTYFVYYMYHIHTVILQ